MPETLPAPDGQESAIQELRAGLAARGFSEKVTNASLSRVLVRCEGRIGVAEDALMMKDRPGWLRLVVGAKDS